MVGSAGTGGASSELFKGKNNFSTGAVAIKATMTVATASQRRQIKAPNKANAMSTSIGINASPRNGAKKKLCGSILPA